MATPRRNANAGESDLSAEGEASRSQDAGTRVDTPMLFEFVTNDGNNRSLIRRHAMRESWRQRNRGRSNSPITRTPPRQRELLPRNTHPRRTGSNSNPESTEVSDVEMVDDARRSYSSEPDEMGFTQRQEEFDDGALTSDGIYLDLRHTITPTSERRSTEWSLSTVPSCYGHRPTPYQSVGDADIDPFDTIRLSREDKKLLYHWVHTYAHQAFGVPADPVFDPIRNLYVAIDLAQPASVHASLAHSASHIAFLRQERDSSIQAIAHKMAAIQLINQSLDDPVKAISDENLSAVCRLLTFERYWGTEAAWKLHQKGLVQMIKKRGGLSTFQSNWKLELRVHLISLMRRPRWNKPVFASHSPYEPDPISEQSFDVLQDYAEPHSNFVSFFAEITTVSPETTERYPAITRAILQLRSTTTTGQEVARLICLFYIAVIFKHAHRSHYDLSWLSDSLEMTEHIWINSVETLRWMLLQGMGRGPKVPESLRRTEKLAEVARMLQVNSWRRMEDRYCTLLLDGSPNGIENAPWNSNLFDDDDDDD